MTERRSLLDRIADHLERTGVPFALIGAGALAVHGVSRSTLDLDLLAVDPRPLDPAFWSLPADVTVDIRRGDAADPLAGVVRCRAEHERDVDVVIGRSGWQANLIGRAEPTRRAGRLIPAARVEDLILLKLYAGGSQDRWDIEQLLERTDRAVIVAAVEHRLGELPASARQIWVRILEGA